MMRCKDLGEKEWERLAGKKVEEDSDTGMYHLEYLIVSVPTSASASDGLGGSVCAQAHVDGERWVVREGRIEDKG